MSRVFCGPWVGEFGHELFAWQGYLRKNTQKYDEVIVACQTGHEALYEDFADVIINYDPDCTNFNMWVCEGHTPPPLHEQYQPCDWIQPGVVQYLPGQLNVNMENQLFGKFGKKTKEYGYVYHARNTEKLGTAIRNWTHWDELLSRLDAPLVCIGDPKQSAYHGGEDMRGVPLRDLFDVLAGAKMIIGSSSGPMHLATLCGCPQVVWGAATNEVRYKKDWNPLGTPVAFIPNWQPTVDEVLQAIKSLC